MHSHRLQVLSAKYINKQLRSPAQNKDDCHQVLLKAIVQLIVDRANNGQLTTIVQVKSYIGIHGTEVADRLCK